MFYFGSFLGRLYRRDQITKTFPEGTDWVGLMDGFSSVSVGFKNNVSLDLSINN